MTRVLITGGAKRLGRHLALGLARDGWAVAIHYNSSRDAAEDIVSVITKEGGKAVAIQADLTHPDNLTTLIEESASRLGGPLTALINNASTFIRDSAEDPHAYAQNMAVNLHAPIQLSRAFASQAERGVILHMLDQRVLKPNPLYFSYSLSKAALYWAMKTQAQSFAPRIRVCGIGPGPTLRNVDQTEGEFAAESAHTLLGHGSPPDTILDAARYLLSAKAFTGQMIAVDGGQHLNWATEDLQLGERP